MPFRLTTRWLHAICWLAAPLAASAQTAGGGAVDPAPTAAQLEPVVITATRTEAQAFDVPASIDRISGDDVRDGRAQINISESLGAVPGLLARDRQNYAQDVQISVRGFGARSTFGIRGVRLYVDGIPATLPDGQGQISNVDLGSVARIEVLRGPFSALYGNSAGGVIQVFTEEGAGAPRLGFGVAAGSDGLLRLSAQAAGATGPLGYVVSASRFSTDGYRDHSATERNLGNAKLTVRPDADSKLTLIANSVALPQAEDPLGLSRAQFEANPRGVDPAALVFDTRKRVNQTQGGLVYERRIDAANAIRLLGYLGHRGTEQFQSIPVATQTNPLHPGGVIVLGRDFSGTDLRWTWKTRVLDAPFTLVSGVAYDTLSEHRQGFQNFIGKTTGVLGALRRDEINDVSNFDQYVQAAWQISPRWALNAGLRHSNVRFRSTDGYIVGTNRDDSGNAGYSATLPVLGVMFALSDAVHLYATAGRGFETPTLNELAYRANAASGLNFALAAARSDSVEAGVKTRLAGFGEFTAALFQTGTDNEIVTQTNVGGRATYQNAGATRRTGVELGWANTFVGNLRAQVALTALDAKYRDAFGTCTATPCATPNQVIPAGNRIPGVARGVAFASLNWAPLAGWRGGVEARYLTGVVVNDANSDAAPAYATVATHLGYVFNAGRWELGGFARVDNLFARTYAGSVIVNEGNGRFFEPAPGRTWLASTSATLRF
ncbi:MAG: TonB-dependent receptor [Pseudomonadota bacterium]|nr:TonB-dependent receptor [Pseudomonadota bacterium]